MKKKWKSLTMPKKNFKGGPLGFFNIHSVGEYQKIEGEPFVENFRKKSLRAENTLREYHLAPLSFLDVKILLRKLSKNCKKSGPFRVRL